MNLHQHLNSRADCLTHRPHSLDGKILLGTPDVCPPWVAERVELERGKAPLDDIASPLGVLVRSAGMLRPAIRVDPNPLAAGSAQQVVHRLTACLANDVPQRLLDGAERRPV